MVAYLGLFMLCVSYQVDERTCVQFSMKVSCNASLFSYFPRVRLFLEHMKLDF